MSGERYEQDEELTASDRIDDEDFPGMDEFVQKAEDEVDELAEAEKETTSKPQGEGGDDAGTAKDGEKNDANDETVAKDVETPEADDKTIDANDETAGEDGGSGTGTEDETETDPAEDDPMAGIEQAEPVAPREAPQPSSIDRLAEQVRQRREQLARRPLPDEQTRQPDGDPYGDDPHGNRDDDEPVTVGELRRMRAADQEQNRLERQQREYARQQDADRTEMSRFVDNKIFSELDRYAATAADKPLNRNTARELIEDQLAQVSGWGDEELTKAARYAIRRIVEENGGIGGTRVRSRQAAKKRADPPPQEHREQKQPTEINEEDDVDLTDPQYTSRQIKNLTGYGV